MAKPVDTVDTPHPPESSVPGPHLLRARQLRLPVAPKSTSQTDSMTSFFEQLRGLSIHQLSEISRRIQTIEATLTATLQ